MASRRPGGGRKPKPNAQKKLSGSKHVNKNAIEFAPIVNADPPAWLPALAAQMWQTVCPTLCKHGILAHSDLHILEAFCVAYSNWRAAQNEIISNGVVVVGATGGPLKNPACTVANESIKQFHGLGASLGLDPASRGKLIGSQSTANKNPFSDF